MLMWFLSSPKLTLGTGCLLQLGYSRSNLVKPLCQGHHQPSSEGTLVPELTVLFVCQGQREALVPRDPWHQFISI